MKPQKPYYICACSFGKDSIATVLTALQHNEPLDEVVFTEVMFNKRISGEIPEHIAWIRNVAIPRLEAMGVKVRVLRSKQNYVSIFNHIVTRTKHPERVGRLHGFPLGGKCTILRDCKLQPMQNFVKRHPRPVITYVGIAAGETARLNRKTMQDGAHISLLAKYGITEQMAYDMCKDAGLLSPIYKTGTRGGCWFCPNQRLCEMRTFRKQHPNLWQHLERLAQTPNLISPHFKYNMTFKQLTLRLNFDDRQLTIEF